MGDFITDIGDSITYMGDVVTLWQTRAVADDDVTYAQEVSRALGRLRVALDDAYARAGRDHGLTAQQAELLCAARSPAAVGDLARVLRCDRSNVSRLVDRAAGRGLVERAGDDQDGRVSRIRLTASGEQLAADFVGSLEAQLAPLVATWPPGRRRAAARLAHEIAEALDTPRDHGSR